MKRIILVVISNLVAMVANAEYTLSLAKCYYGDTPVIQHGVTNCMFGTVYQNGIPVSGVRVDARIGSVKSVVSEPSDDDGSWYAYLPPMKPCATPIALVLSIGGKDVLAPGRFMVGDVWLCGGQSNMATRMSDSYDFESYITDATSDIRQYGVSVGVSDAPQEFSTPGGHWASSTSYTGAIAAVPFLFARALRKSGVTIPIGIVNVAASGKKIEMFLSPEMVAFDPVLSNEVANVVDTADGTRGFQHWNAMYEPFRHVKFKGMIWYQGEDNINLSADEYGRRLLAFINGIRKIWGADFPFYSVQLASYGSWVDKPEGQKGWPDVRTGQFSVFRQTGNSGLAVANDLFANDAHPKAKVLIADRLARFARNGIYGQAVEAIGPVIDKVTYQGNRIRLTFKENTIGCGIVIGIKDWRNNDEPVPAASLGVVTNINGFAISEDNITWHWADGYIATDNSVVLSNSVCAYPRYIHFSQLDCNVGWDRFAKNVLAGGVNLYGKMKDGTLLPAFPFETMNATSSEAAFPPARDYEYVPGSDDDPPPAEEEPQPIAYDAIFCGADRYLTLDAACAANETTPFAWLVVTKDDMFMSAVRVADVYPRITKFDSGGLLQVDNAVKGLSYGISISSDLTQPFSAPEQWRVSGASGMNIFEFALPCMSSSLFVKVVVK